MTPASLLFLVSLSFSQADSSAASCGEHALAVIPRPVSLSCHDGSFVLTRATAIVADRATEDIGRMLAEFLAPATGFRLRVGTDMPASGAIVLRLDSTLAALADEGYRLEVTPARVTIRAYRPAGVFYGVETLRQLLPGAVFAARVVRGATWSLPAVTIEDLPRFRWRGAHLDVGRHFFPVAFIKRYIDLLALHKLNTFHWHLTEDQGWRVEIRKYPRLTRVGGCRRETVLEKNVDPYVGDGVRYCGHYTQREVRDVVAYAARRFVTVVPEIEMPGHSKAALAAYPELACTPGPFEVATVWGVHEDVFCPSERTFAFLEDVLGEVLALFPSRYVHIGGDEVPKRRWHESPLAQQLMQREHLADEHELQSYFIKRIERFLLAHGRRLVGWDEILEGGLAPEATVMSWRGMEGGVAAARQGHDVIMTPYSNVYFDYYQGDPAFEPLAIGGFTPLEKVYAFEPVPPELTPDEARHVLGAQANVWTEYMTTPDKVEYMVFPRLLALAEVLWSPREARSWDDFARRLPHRLAALDRIGVNYRIPHPTGLETDRLSLSDTITVTLGSLLPGAEIRYTTDGSDPTARATLYGGPFPLAVTDQGTRLTARVFLPGSRSSPARGATFSHTALRDPEPLADSAVAPGLRVAYYEADVKGTRALDSLPAQKDTVAADVGLLGSERPEQFGLVFTGFLRAPEDGIYRFTLTSDDGSVLTIGDRVVVDHDGLHATTDKTGLVALRAGDHPVRLAFFQGPGGKALGLRMEIERNGAPAALAPEWRRRAPRAP